MPSTVTYKAPTPFGYLATVDHVAVKAQKLAGFLNEVEGLRSPFLTGSDAAFWNKQMRQLGELFQSLVDEMIEDADSHGLEADEDGEVLHAPGFDMLERRVP